MMRRGHVGPAGSPNAGCAGIRRALGRVMRQTTGTASIEFAFTAIPLILCLYGLVEFGRLYWLQSGLQFATEAAARYVTMNPSASSSTVQTYAASQVYGFSVSASEFTVTAYSSATNTPACGNKVTISHPFTFIITGSLVNYRAVTLQAAACHNG